MNRHVKICEHCGREQHAANYRRHIRNAHPQAPDIQIKGQQLYCHGCNKTFAKSQRSRHVKKYHAGEEPPEESIVRPQTCDEVHHQISQEAQEIQEAEILNTPPPLPPAAYREMIQDAKSSSADYLASMAHLMGPTTERLQRELPAYTSIMNEAVVPDLVEYDSHILSDISWKHVDHQKRAYQLIMCSDSNVKEILQHTTPGVNLLIPRERNSNPSPRLNLPDFLDFLASKGQVDVHRYETDAGDKSHNSNFVVPVVWDGRTAVREFRSPSKMPLNFLNLDTYKSNPQCSFTADNHNLQILRTVRAEDSAGKRNTEILSDLTNSHAFHLCGKKGVWSMPHIDHHGVMTVVCCEDGEKVWLVYPHLNDDELREWADSEKYSPKCQPYAVFLRPGDIFIQIPGTVHAPYSKTDVLMSGTMHWDSRNLLQVVSQSLLELDQPTVTNENTSGELLGKLKALERLWYDRGQPWEWGSEEEREQFSALLLTLEKRAAYCDCSNGCRSATCPCRALEQPCKTDKCHQQHSATTRKKSANCRNRG